MIRNGDLIHDFTYSPDTFIDRVQGLIREAHEIAEAHAPDVLTDYGTDDMIRAYETTLFALEKALTPIRRLRETWDEQKDRLDEVPRPEYDREDDAL